MTNPNGGVACRMVAAPGYLRKPPRWNRGNLKLNLAGIWSHTTEWPFEYSEDDVIVPDPMPKFTAYKPVGMIKQAPACKRDYKGKNIAGGRKCPSTYIGAALRLPKDPMKGIEDYRDVSVLFSIGSDTISLTPNRY